MGIAYRQAIMVSTGKTPGGQSFVKGCAMPKNRPKLHHRPWSVRENFDVALAQYIYEVREGHRLCIPDARRKLDDAIDALAGAESRTAWAVQRVHGDYKHPCLFGSLRDALENKDADERVIQIEYRVVARA
jgi:hypothetical protein